MSDKLSESTLIELGLKKIIPGQVVGGTAVWWELKSYKTFFDRPTAEQLVATIEQESRRDERLETRARIRKELGL
jgi:hypothetical protein